jgi:type III pantothenate kinase
MTERQASDSGEPTRIVAVSVGNTNTSFALYADLEGSAFGSLPSGDGAAIASAVLERFEALSDALQSAVVIASVNAAAADALTDALRSSLPTKVFRLGEDLDIPLQGRLDPEALTGQDRILNALAAYETMGQACVVVDAGTAITIDFVDGEGVFHGGAIAPGVRMALDAMHRGTSALPKVEFAAPDADSFFGRDTTQAMLHGAFYGARGLVRLLTERYAEAYDAYPPVIATGGDARALFEQDELVDRIVPDLTLRGIAIACRSALGTMENDA